VFCDGEAFIVRRFQRRLTKVSDGYGALGRVEKAGNKGHFRGVEPSGRRGSQAAGNGAPSHSQELVEDDPPVAPADRRSTFLGVIFTRSG